jgi:hypothetical protein
VQAGRAVAQVIKYLEQFERTVSSRSGQKQLSAATQAILFGMVEPIRLDAETLRGSI